MVEALPGYRWAPVRSRGPKTPLFGGSMIFCGCCGCWVLEWFLQFSGLMISESGDMIEARLP